MSTAERCLQMLTDATTTLSTRRAAVLCQTDFNYGSSIDHMDEGYILYYFSDGSVLATRGRGRNTQRWIVEPTRGPSCL